VTYEATFKALQPKAVDFTMDEYRAASDEIHAAARATGYRLAGFRLGVAVFTSKLPVEPANPQGDALGQ
jgi:hypothetical protein